MRRREFVEVSGLRSVTGSLTWAQLALWKAIGASPPDDPAFVLTAVWPAEIPVRQALVRLGELLARHESLRTNYADGPRRQIVSPHRVLPVDISEYDELPTVDDARRTAAALREPSFDIRSDVLLRIHFLVHAGLVRFAALAVHHLAADGWSLELLRREFAGSSGEDRPVEQPYDRSVFERSSAGERIQRRTVEHWLHRIELAPRVLVEPVGEVTEQTVEMWALESVEAADAIRAAAKRENTTTSTVVLAALTRVLAESAGVPDCFLRIITAVRPRPSSRSLIGAFNQEAALYVSGGSATFAEHLRSCASAVMQAYLRTECDCEVLGAAVDDRLARRGIQPGGYCFFNDIRFAMGPPVDSLSGGPEMAAGLYEMAPIAQAGAMFFASFVELAHMATITLSMDRRFLPGVGADDILRRTERLLVLAGADEVASAGPR